MISPNIQVMFSTLVLGCINLFAFEKENVTIRGSFDNSRFSFESKMEGTVAFMGGSITEMNGYRPMLMEFLKTDFLKQNFHSSTLESPPHVPPLVPFVCSVMSYHKGPIDLFFWSLR